MHTSVTPTCSMALLINPRAKKSKRNPGLIAQLKNQFPKSQMIFEPPTHEALQQTLATLKNNNIQILFIFGGDGTIRTTLHYLNQIYQGEMFPKIILLQGGTMNVLSSTFQGRMGPLTHMERVLQGMFQPGPVPTKKIQTLLVNGTLGFIFAVGGFANFIDEYRQAQKPSTWTAFKMIVSLMFSYFFKSGYYSNMFPMFKARVKAPDQTEQTNTYVTIASSTCANIGFSLKPFINHQVNQTFSNLEIRTTPLKLFLNIFRLWKAAPLQDSRMGQWASASIEIITDEPQKAMMDGDMLETQKSYAVKLGPVFEMIHI